MNTLSPKPTPTAVIPSPLIASFRLFNDYYHLRHIYFSAVPRIMGELEAYGTVTPTQHRGIFLLEVHPLVDYFGLRDHLKALDGLKME
jgi:hypothetical protein